MKNAVRRAGPALLALAGLLGGAVAAAPPPAEAAPRHPLTGQEQAGEEEAGREKKDPAHTDVLFIGAHPDDESMSLATLGQLKERHGLSTGVVTITRGEGGGNAVGPEEGPQLGLIRETEEREAVAHAGVRNVFYLDKPDFWYTLSAPLADKLWAVGENRQDTLERLVRLIRATTPKTVVTMDPRPFDQHGAHQEGARLATEAFQLAGKRTAFPEQISREKYRPWQSSRLLAQNGAYEGPVGKKCAAHRGEDPHTGLPVTGAWTGAISRETGTTWAQVERDAARVFRTQGFDTMLPPKVTTPRDELGCEWFSVLAEHGEPVKAEVRPQGELKPLYAEFRDWATRAGMPWLANEAQPDYPDNPSTTVPRAERRPAVDGKAGPDEYPGPELPLRHWQNEECEGTADCAATARTAWHGDSLYVLFDVTDDERGTALEQSDCKRHWRTDSVEIDLDPRGTSDDTSTTFKAGILPYTKEGGPCAGRDADNHQGPASATAPGMDVASTLKEKEGEQDGAAYAGYTVEAEIPLSDLPAAVDPRNLTANFLLYDSDTQDKTGQTRLAWSPYGSAQADPYVWGGARLDGFTAPPERPQTPPVIPLEAAQSKDSPASVVQSRRTGVPLAAGPRDPGERR
ncbi:PIG-L family deacetylase [Streptomyces sp. NPDC054796]